MTGSSLAAELDIRSFGARCNGSDDSGAVQSALNALLTGDTLNVPCQASIGASGLRLNNKSGVTVRGINGGGFKALALTPTRFVLHITSCLSCEVEGLVIDAANKGVGGLFFQGTEKTTAENNQISNITPPAAAGLVGLGNKNNRYIGNVVLNTGANYSSTGQMQDSSRGLWLGNPGTSTYEWYAYIANNRLRNISGSAIVFHGTSAHITGNVATELSWSGAKVVGAASATGTTVIENNVFSGRGGSGYTGGGVAVSGEGGTRENVIVRNNTMQADQEAGVYVTDGPHAGAITITGNTIRGTYQSGITLVATSVSTTITNNRIEQGPLRTIHGIRILSNRGLSIRNVTIADNVIQGQSQDAIHVINNGGIIDGVVVHNNALMNTGGQGLHIEEYTPGIYNLGVTNNCFMANAQGTLYDNRGSRAFPRAASSFVCDTASRGPITTADTTTPAVSLTSPVAGTL